jgi:hypothetical protein
MDRSTWDSAAKFTTARAVLSQQAGDQRRVANVALYKHMACITRNDARFCRLPA